MHSAPGKICDLLLKERREWDSNPCGPEGPRALKARALSTLPSRLFLFNWALRLFLFSVFECAERCGLQLERRKATVAVNRGISSVCTF